MPKYLLTHNSHELSKGDIYEGDELPAWLVGKVKLISESTLEVATPEKKKGKGKSDVDNT
ncbi:hypothetical protein ABN222_07375 [Providencia alcalifaciens]